MIRRNVLKNLSILSIALSLSACNLVDDSDAPPRTELFSDANVTVLLDGETWLFVSGRAIPSALRSSSYELELWDKKVLNPCDFDLEENFKVLDLSLPDLKNREPTFSEYTVTHYKSQTELSGHTFLVFESTRFEVTAETEDRLKAELNLVHDDENGIKGEFNVPICD